MSRIIKLLLPALVIIAGVLVVLPGMVVGAGYLLSLVVPLSLFECSLLSLGSALLAMLIFFGTVLVPPVSDADTYDEESLLDELLEDGDEEEDIERIEKAFAEARGPSPRPTAGRNAPCPCGSGKKYKLCCGRA